MLHARTKFVNKQECLLFHYSEIKFTTVFFRGFEQAFIYFKP